MGRNHLEYKIHKFDLCLRVSLQVCIGDTCWWAPQVQLSERPLRQAVYADLKGEQLGEVHFVHKNALGIQQAAEGEFRGRECITRCPDVQKFDYLDHSAEEPRVHQGLAEA